MKNEFKGKFLENFPLSEYTSFKCGGNAKYLVYPENIEDVFKIVKFAKIFNEKILILGKGTNVLISDKGFDGIVISTLKMEKYTIRENTIICECGLLLANLLKICIKNSFSGLEFLAGIPGTVGGGVKCNAGLKKEYLSDRILFVEYIDFEKLDVFKKERKEIFFDYRKSEFNENSFIWKTGITVENDDAKKIKKKIKEYMNKRIKTQPLGYSAGSIFKNPYPYYAGNLIEKCGLKGYSLGNCFISPKHANFIINKGKAKAEDIYKLIKLVQNKVKEKFNIELELEINLIGEFE
ncbi:MAG: UDP-N-acetylmuramate dehydrogenase [Candidatus Omnitrophica bacterium]|nr:UDP-N-acetylmuramate dehydrogenase [Candidatus Omnitrophota bacterium]